MEENFSMEWNMEWKIFSMEWNGRKLSAWNMEKSSSIPFHTMPCLQRLADNAMRQRYADNGMDKTGQTQKKSKDVFAAFEIGLSVAVQKQPHTIAESLILPGAKILVKRVFVEQTIAKLNDASLSDNMIKRRIEEMSDDITDQILAEIKELKFGFAIQLDQSTDITNIIVNYLFMSVMLRRI